MLVADHFSLHGHNFLVIANRFTGWNAIVSTTPGKFDGQHLVTILKDFCATWNIPEHITTNGGPQMMSGVFNQRLKDWASHTAQAEPTSHTATAGLRRP